ncbi:TonB-dependent receptor plug domain-containing protein [candidate division CSSED10-310 bacterium]|uniref:TonB-dependent receptor plug domain-containing protein n=1 Tax=candidate division CSSED10-310 bacterium TaxID=2855610 RepID=A0ABV6YWD4_UNCC1
MKNYGVPVRFKIASCAIVFCLGISVLFSMSIIPALAQDDDNDLVLEYGLELLLDMEITSVLKKPQKLSEVAAAVFVITKEDIRSSGVTTIADALRMAPGVNVARLDSNKWAISIRGFLGRFSNKLLVLIDGRSIYSPSFSGVEWELHDLVLDDIARIEVIRGPGGAIWGANAVNGVINIITENAQNTEEGLLDIGAGTEESVLGSFRYGGALTASLSVRGYIKYFERDAFVDKSGSEAFDDWKALHGGFRGDWSLSEKSVLSFNGAIFDVDVNQMFTTALLEPPYSQRALDSKEVSGSDLMLSWDHTFLLSSISVKTYFNHFEAKEIVVTEERETFDVEFQHNFLLADYHEISWGLGYRETNDSFQNTLHISSDPDSHSFNIFSTFINGEFTIRDNLLFCIVGSKFEDNDFTGFEVQPNVRFLLTPTPHNSVWLSASRAVRTPARSDEHSRTSLSSAIPPDSELNPYDLPILIVVYGNDDILSEELLSYEMGYRATISEKLLFDVAAFYNIYDNLVSIEEGEPHLDTYDSIDYIAIPYEMQNKLNAITYGGEIVCDWQAAKWLRMQAAYSYLYLDFTLDDDSTDIGSKLNEGRSPQNQFSLRISSQFAKLEFSTWFRYVDEIPEVISEFTEYRSVPSYTTLDCRLTWKLHKQVELSFVGQNLIEEQHLEYTPDIFTTDATEIERSVYGKLTFRF